MFRKVLLIVVVTFFLSTPGLAQLYSTQYRPPNQDWQFLKTPHFKLVYASGNDSIALKMGQILEEQYPVVQDLVGGELHNFPVVLNDYNDRANGFVTPIHFRSEIELPPIKSKSLNPQTGNWLENVGPHELVHALQLSNLGDYNFPRLVNLFSPDLARSFHGAIPMGIIEGIAVHHETENIAPHGGRGNHSYFTNQFDATFGSDRRWSMGQIVHPSADTRPFARHYIGGYEFTAWMHGEYGNETTREAIDFFMDYPFLGYGTALRHATGQWPGELYNRFEDTQEQETKKNNFSTQITELHIPYSGREIRRPQWRSDNELIFYGSFYNARPGFYSYYLNNDKLSHLITTNSTSDYNYDLSQNRASMVFSYYEADGIYDYTTKVELVRYNFETHQKEQLTQKDRLYAPVFLGDTLLALQTKPASSALVTVNQNSDQSPSINEIVSLGEHEIKAVAVHPENNKVAVVANKRGIQALWIADRTQLEKELKRAPDISFHNGSIFDPDWHPSGKKLLFSADFSGTQQLYEFTIDGSHVQQVTRAQYGAFEGSYSPSGDKIAFIRQVKNERLPAIVDRKNFLGNVVKPELWQHSQSKTSFMQRPMVSDSIKTESVNWQMGDYSAGIGWLKPRTVLPIVEEISNRNEYQFGLSLHSNTLLADQRYWADFSYAQDRGWYNLEYQNKSFYPGFKARIFSRPGYVSVSAEQNESTYTLLRQERGLAVSVPFQYRISQNIFSTSFYVEPEFRQSQFRFFNINAGNTSSDFANSSIVNVFGQFNYRLQQNIRDLQPNSGLRLYAEFEHYLAAGSTDLSLSDNQNAQFDFKTPTALRGGLFSYFSPIKKWNQSLRLGVQGITQSNIIFDNQFMVSKGFSEPILPNSNSLINFSTRYTIPLWYVDDGGFLLPLYLNNVYLVAFSNTVTDPAKNDWYHNSRSVFGVEFRTQFRLSNLTLDVGVGFGYEPSRKNTQFYLGNF